MRKYLRTAVFIYVAFCIGCAIWWIFVSDVKTLQTSLPNVIYPSITLNTPTLRSKRINPASRLSIHRSATRKHVEHLITLQRNRNDQDRYIDSIMKGQSFCNGRFIGYDRTFAKLTDVIIDPSKGKGRRGGENIKDVLNQPEANEYYILNFGYFKQRCSEKIRYTFNSKSHVRQWLDVLETTPEKIVYETTIKEWTIAVKRYEYVNLYHTMTDFYNAFLVYKAFNMSLGNITILWIDGHPSGTLDSTWETLFGHVLRAGYIAQPSKFNQMIWGIMGYDSLLSQFERENVPYLEEFRDFFLTRHAVSTKTELNCTNLKMMFLWRRDYVAHPRNPSGSVSRKIANEDELLEKTKKRFPHDNVTGLQIDKLNMQDQLKVIANVDILIGMHGAGLTHTLFLPQHAGLIELYPTYWSNANTHFKSMARWRNLHYLTWNNIDRSKELQNQFTIVNVDFIIDLISQMKQKICK